MFLASKHFLLADTFVKKICFYRFFLHQTQSKHDSNVREKSMVDIIYRKSCFGRAGVSVDSGFGMWGWASS